MNNFNLLALLDIKAGPMPRILGGQVKIIVKGRPTLLERGYKIL